MRILPVLALTASAVGCQYDTSAHLYTTDKPQITNVAGRYVLSAQTPTRDGLGVLRGKISTIELRSDGTFVAVNVPPWPGLAPRNLFETVISGAGTWRIDGVGSIDDGRERKRHWGVYLESDTAKFQPAGLTGSKPPYGLIYTLGDPDSGQALIFERVN